jgi:hypothetical protein
MCGQYLVFHWWKIKGDLASRVACQQVYIECVSTTIKQFSFWTCWTTWSLSTTCFYINLYLFTTWASETWWFGGPAGNLLVAMGDF